VLAIVTVSGRLECNRQAAPAVLRLAVLILPRRRERRLERLPPGHGYRLDVDRVKCTSGNCAVETFGGTDTHKDRTSATTRLSRLLRLRPIEGKARVTSTGAVVVDVRASFRAADSVRRVSRAGSAAVSASRACGRGFHISQGILLGGKRRRNCIEHGTALNLQAEASRLPVPGQEVRARLGIYRALDSRDAVVAVDGRRIQRELWQWLTSS
jgi:hypothetical protein